MAKKSTRQANRDRFHLISGILIVSVLLLSGSGIGYWWWINKTAGLDGRLCPKDGPKGHTIILIDKTDPLSFVQKPALNQLIAEVAGRHGSNYPKPDTAETPVGVGELLSIFVLGEDYKATPEPIFSRCNPGLGTDANLFLVNQRKLEELYKKEYDDLLKESQKTFTAERASKWSPIMEMLQMVSVNGFRQAGTLGARRLIVISDMLHNTQAYSHFKQTQNFAQFQKETYYQQVQTDLSNVNIDIRYLMYTPALQTTALTYFWDDYFRSLGATLNSAKPL